jgi:hypothetical protein
MNDYQFHVYHSQVKQELNLNFNVNFKLKFNIPLQAVASSLVIGNSKFESVSIDSVI